MRSTCRFAAAILFWVFQASSQPQVPEASIPDLKVETARLSNGLEVFMVEDHRLPRVAVNLWYHVGPVNEEPGRTGFAHLFEHMMFQQSQHVGADEHFRLLEAAGASDVNGTTGFDRTNYFETVPSHELELALWLESDRMGFLLEKVDAEALRNQQDVVRNERRQSTENVPFGIVEEAMFQGLFPKTHPYYGVVIGSHADIQAAKLDDVRTFFKQYYSPNNASLSIVGDIDKVKTMALVEKYFGTLKRGADAPPIRVVTPPITSERRLTVADRVELPRIYMAWLTPPVFTPGDAEAAIAARILGEGKSSRLYRSLVYEKQIAQDVRVWLDTNTLASIFVIQATARPGHNLDELEKEIDLQLNALRSASPDSKELDQAKAGIETATLISLERIGGFSGIADRLNMYNHHLKNPNYLREDILRFRRVNADQIREFAQKYLVNTARVVVHGVPGTPALAPPVPTPDKTADAGSTPQSINADEAWRSVRPRPGTAATLKLPQPESFQLSNGLTVILDQRREIPLVAANLVFRSGSGSNPADKPGLASLAVEMLDEGTATRSALQFSDDLALIGARFRTSASMDFSSLTLTVMKRSINEGLNLLADAALNPAFPEEEIERQRLIRLGTIAQNRESASTVADGVFALALHGPESPYAYMEIGTERSLRALKRDDLRAFWSQHFIPNNAALIVSGDVSRDELRPLLERTFGNWKSGSPRPAASSPSKPTTARVVIVDKPGAPQTQLRVGLAGPSRSTPDYEPLQVMNTILGGAFSSRINMNLREEHGYTYGANSRFVYLRSAGSFFVSSGVRTDVTVPAVQEVMREIGRISEAEVTSGELTMARERLAGALPARFETSEQTVNLFADVYAYNLGLDYYTDYAAKVTAVSAEKVQEMSRKYLLPERMIILAVGDRARFEQDLRKLGLGAVEVRSLDGAVIQP
jgi:zinc protease